MTDNTPWPDPLSPLRWGGDALELLEQTLLPTEETWIRCTDPEQVADAIRRLAVRGAPAIGVSAAYGLVVGMQSAASDGETSEEALRQRFGGVFDLLAGTRPTAVNLRWALDQGREVFEDAIAGGSERVRSALLEWAQRIHAEDVAANRKMGAFGAELFRKGDRVMTHCNAGALATAGWGTAVGVIRSSWEEGRLGKVWVDETRPLLQGARLTSWELKKLGIPFQLVTDNSAGALMSRGYVDRVVVGADRIAANGDVANKIGTYVVAVLAHRHGVPFYVAAPLSTIDRGTSTGADIPIEERRRDEVTEVFGTRVAPDEIDALNIAFDVTPNDLVTAIITDEGVLETPYEESIQRAFERREAGT